MDRKSPIFIKSVPVKANKAFTEAISICLQEILGIECMETLTPAESVKFEKEVSLWYKSVPKHWNGSYQSFELHHSGFLSREVHIGSDDKNPYVINFAHF